MLRILFFLCVPLFAVDGWVMGAHDIFTGDTDSSSQLSHKEIAKINPKLINPVNAVAGVQKCEANLKRVVYVANILGQRNSSKIREAARSLNAARIKEAEALRQAEEQQRKCLLEENRSRINGLTNKMLPLYQEIYRAPLAKVLSTNREDIFMTYYYAALKEQQLTQGEVTNRVLSINEALKKLDIRV